MTALAITPCCGVVKQPNGKRQTTEARALLRQGICPLCHTDLKAPIVPEDSGWTFRGKKWFQCNAERGAKGTWAWSDISAEIFRALVDVCNGEHVRDDVGQFFSYDVYTEYVDVFGIEDSVHVLALKRVKAWFDEVSGAWHVPAHKAESLLEVMPRFYVYPSVLQAIEVCKAHYSL